MQCVHMQLEDAVTSDRSAHCSHCTLIYLVNLLPLISQGARVLHLVKLEKADLPGIYILYIKKIIISAPACDIQRHYMYNIYMSLYLVNVLPLIQQGVCGCHIPVVEMVIFFIYMIII